MGGGLIQLTNQGSQDIYLTGNPQITFFKKVYRRYTNFSMETIQQVGDGLIDASRMIIYKILRNADLIHNCFLQIPINSSMIQGPNNLGYSIISEARVEIGGQVIDKQPGAFLEIYSELNEPQNNLHLPNYSANGSNTLFNSQFQYLSCTGGVPLKNASGSSDNLNYNWNSYVRDRKYIYVPLRFWFCNDVGLSLPLIALQYNEVLINIKFTDLGDSVNDNVYNPNVQSQSSLFVNYIFLDNEERRRFAQISHEYLIDVVQSIEQPKNEQLLIDISFFKNPVKEIIWCGSSEPISSWGKNGSYTNVSGSSTEWHIEMNGAARMPNMNVDYYTNMQPYSHHNNRGVMLDTNGSDTNSIALYSFCLNPTEYQPSGTCNFSAIEKPYLIRSDTTNSPDYIYIFAISYNVLRIMSGMAALAYT